MINIGKGIITGLVASAAVAATVFLGTLIGVLPAIDPVRAAGGIMHSPTRLAWVAHCALGTFLSGTFRGVEPGSAPTLLVQGHDVRHARLVPDALPDLGRRSECAPST